jgi:cytidine deaminase
MVTTTITDEAIATLINTAIEASRHAYVPYSGYRVGAALRAVDGTVYGGCNIENASYSATVCAERTAVVKAVSEGQRAFDAIVVTTQNGGFPCGACRQVLYEFSPEMRVIIANTEGRVLHDIRLADLLPHGFGPSSLEP